MDCCLPGSPLGRGLSMGLSRQEHWSGLPYPQREDLPNPGIPPVSLCLLYWQVGSLPLGPPGKPAYKFILFSSVQFSHSVMSDSLWPHGLQHTRLPCPSPTPRACSCPSSQWCHPTVSSSVVPFSSCLQSSLATGSFPMNQLFTSGGQSIGALFSATVFPMNIWNWFPLRLTGWISSLSKGFSRVFSNITVKKHQFFCSQLSLWSNFHIHIWLLEEP